MIENLDYKIHTSKENLENLELKGLYLIRNLDNNMLKIGVAENLKNRFKGLTSTFKHCGFSPKLNIECFIECEDNYGLENYLHSEFKELNYKNEWFNIHDFNTVIDRICNYNFKNISKNTIEDNKNNNYNDSNKIIKSKCNKISKDGIFLLKESYKPIKYKTYKYYKFNGVNIYFRSKYVFEKDISLDINNRYFKQFGKRTVITLGYKYYDKDFEEDTIYCNTVSVVEYYEELERICNKLESDIIICENNME